MNKDERLTAAVACLYRVSRQLKHIDDEDLSTAEKTIKADVDAVLKSLSSAR